ncbi:MAG: GNAT family N-acetyltransferase [Actinobacteria bacterium 13_2_20CM_2_71_6]|nr:MAG: GNAT family N-acetyltransferase [Actinobacteria bacterium 13_2_20CM_2_71_6]
MRFELDPPLTDELRVEIVALWTEASNAGGAIGFAADVGPDEVWPLAARAFAGVDEGHDHLLVGYAGDTLAAMLFFVSHRFALADHWRTVKRLMVRPSLQGRGYGAALLREAEAVARRFGWEALHLTIRDGTGLERFYAAAGYREVGRLPGALRLRPGDDRDEAHLWLGLR